MIATDHTLHALDPFEHMYIPFGYCRHSYSYNAAALPQSSFHQNLDGIILFKLRIQVGPTCTITHMRLSTILPVRSLLLNNDLSGLIVNTKSMQDVH
jgi:hypothetical protein